MRDLKRMRDFCPAPSDAVRAMVMGLRTAGGTKNFFLDMGSYGHVERLGEEKICFGCAATCAILESLDLWARKFEYGDYQVRGENAAVENLTGVAWTDLDRWESAIDALRLGDPGWLYKYYGVDISQHANIPNLPRLGNPYLPRRRSCLEEAELQKYEAFADALSTVGL